MRTQCCGVIYTGGSGTQRCADCPGYAQIYQVPNRLGWICPRCNVVHAPSVQTCQCQNLYNGPTCGPTVSTP